jgi:hypothetical protein
MARTVAGGPEQLARSGETRTCDEHSHRPTSASAALHVTYVSGQVVGYMGVLFLCFFVILGLLLYGWPDESWRGLESNQLLMVVGGGASVLGQYHGPVWRTRHVSGRPVLANFDFLRRRSEAMQSFMDHDAPAAAALRVFHSVSDHSMR